MWVACPQWRRRAAIGIDSSAMWSGGAPSGTCAGACPRRASWLSAASPRQRAGASRCGRQAPERLTRPVRRWPYRPCHVMAEGSETLGGERGGAEGRGRRAAARAICWPNGARGARPRAARPRSCVRAEAAEATVQTLERHVSSLQQRLREAEEERRADGRAARGREGLALEREHELRRVKQREYAEQQLRVEAEERLGRRRAREPRGDRATERPRAARARMTRASSRAPGGLAASARRGRARPRPAEQRRRAARGPSASCRHVSASSSAAAREIQRRARGERAARERSERLLEMHARHGQQQHGGADRRDEGHPRATARRGGACRAPERAARRATAPTPTRPADRRVGRCARMRRRTCREARSRDGATRWRRPSSACAPVRRPAPAARAAGGRAPGRRAPAHKHSLSLIGRCENEAQTGGARR